MPLQSSGIIVVEKPQAATATVCVSQHQQQQTQQLLFAATTTPNASAVTQKSIGDLQYCEYYETNDAHVQQQQSAVVLEHSTNSNLQQQQQQIMRRQQQRSNSITSATSIQQFNVKQTPQQQQQQQQQHMVHHTQQQQQQQQQQQYHHPHHQQQNVVQQPQQMIQVSEELYEQATAAGGNMMISTTGEMLNQQYFKIVTPDGNTGNMIIGSMGNVTGSGQSATHAGGGGAGNSSKVLLSNVTVLSKQSASTTTAGSSGISNQQQQQPQTINFVSTKNLSYLTTTTGGGGGVVGGVSSALTTVNAKQQKMTSATSSYKSSSKQQQHHMMNNTTTTTTTTYLQQTAQHQQQQSPQIVQKMNVPRNVQMVTRVQTLMPPTQQHHQQSQQQQQQQQPAQIVMQQQQQQQQPPQKYVVPVVSNTKAPGSTLKKSTSSSSTASSTMKMSQHKMHNNINQSSSVKTFIHQQQQQQQQNLQQHNLQQSTPQQYQTTNKMKSQKIVKQYNNAINNSTGAVSIATLPQQQQQQQQQSNHTALGTYTINHKLNNHQQQSTKITKLANSKYVMHNNQQQQQQQHQLISSNASATLPHGTQIHHKTMHQQSIGNNSGTNNLMLQQQQQQQQQQLLNSAHANSNAGTIKFVNAHGTVIQQHHQHHASHPQQQQQQTTTVKHQRQAKHQHFSTSAQQLQYVESSSTMSSENIYQLTSNSATISPQQSSATLQSHSGSQQSLISDDIMIVNGTQMTDELSARILQSMAQNSFGNQQRYQQQQHQSKSSTAMATASTTNMPPPQQIVLQQQQQQQQHHHGSNTTAPNTHHQLLSPKEYPIYNPVQHQQQQQQQQQHYVTQHSNYGASNALNSSSNTVSGRQIHSAPNSRAQSMERKLHQDIGSKKSSDYFKVNNNNSSSNSGLSARGISISNNNSTSSIDTHSGGMQTLKSVGTVASTSNNDDDIIGEEVRPVPVNTQDMRLQILHAVLQDHTYANATPTRFPTELASNNQTTTASLQLSSSVTSGAQQQHQQQTPVVPTQHWSLGGIGATVGPIGAAGAGGVASSSHVSGLNAQSLMTPGSGATSYTLYGQQIPRMQQDDDANSAISNGSRVAMGDIDPGEETETAPEAEAEDDSVTRCICDLTHDDGYMICCDKCSAWQHVDCMGIDRQNIPDEYLCELCQPRVVDKARARSLQLMKRKEQTQLLLNAQAMAAQAGGLGNPLLNSSDESLTTQQRLGATVGGGNTLLSGNEASIRLSSISASNTLHGGSNSSSVGNTSSSTTTTKKGKVLKKTKEGGSTAAGKKSSKKAEKLAAAAAAAAAGAVGGVKLQRKETKKNTKRKTKSSGDGAGGGTAAERHAANLRQWIENYELAVTNHYSPELRARLHAISKQPNLLQSITNTENKSLKNCGILDAKATTVPHAGGKILISNLDIAPNCPIFELRGKYMLTTQYKTQNSSINMNSPPPSNYLSSFKAHKIPGPFIFFYQLPGAELPSAQAVIGLDGQLQTAIASSSTAQHLKGPEICVDTRTYGNEARFVRRSCRPNAEIQHLFEKGTIHLFIVSLSDIRASTEITIRHEPHDLLAIEHKKSSQLVIQPTSTACACGLTKDCLFGPPLQQASIAAGAQKSSRKAVTLNGSSAAALQLTMGGLVAPGVVAGPQSTTMALGKKKSQTMNRNRSTSSSGDSNMGLNSPNIAAHNSSLKNLNMLSSNGSFITAAHSSTMHDSGICTSSSSPSVSIPSPSSHIHSPTQQQQQQQQQQHQQQQPGSQQMQHSSILTQEQQHCVQSMQQLSPATSEQRQTLIVQQQQQHHQMLAAVPTTMLPSPHQQMLEKQQKPTLSSTSTLNVIAAAATQVPITSALTPAIEQETQQLHGTEEQKQQTIYVQMPQHKSQQQQHQVTALPIESLGTTPLPNFANPVRIPVLLTTGASATESSLVQLPTPSPAQQADITLAADPVFEQQIQLPSYTTSTVVNSPMPSPQKQNSATATHSVRRSNSKQNNSSRTTSISEDTAGVDQQQHGDCDTTASTQSPSSSNNTTLTSPKEKPKLTRDERKMEAILRAIEKMEKNSQRKQELKQAKRVAKRRASNNSNSSPTQLNKQRATDDNGESAAPISSASAGPGGTRFNLKKSSSYAASRKKKRKTYKKSYNMHGNAAQRKRRKSRTNSNESVDATPDNHTATTSESESNSMLSPQLHATPSVSIEQNSSSVIQSHTTSNFNNSINNDVGVAANVDQAAGLLMAFANTHNAADISSQSENQSPKCAQPPNTPLSPPVNHYLMHEDGSFKSPNRVNVGRDTTVVASPPPTPPAPVSSACMLLEAAVGPLEPMDNDMQNVEFKYPIPALTKTKKVLMTNWLNQSDVSTSTVISSSHMSATSEHLQHASSMGLDSLVQAAMSDYKPQQMEEVENLSMVAKQVEEFIQQTECPPNSGVISAIESCCEQDPAAVNYIQHENYHQNVAMEVAGQHSSPTSSVVRNLHLPLQVSTCSNNSSVKKRWLRQAISEETDENSLTPSATSTPTTSSPSAYPNNVPNGFTTPLKKRRLVISTKDELDTNAECASASTTPPSPVGLQETKTLASPEYDDLHEEAGVDMQKSCSEDAKNTSITRAYDEQEREYADTHDDESEIVDVGNNEELTNCEHTTEHHHNALEVKEECEQEGIPPTELKPEIMEQDDDVDILRSPSPGSQKIVAEDNLVKIEPEDISGNEDVKIDVEREESMAGDKFEEIIELKKEQELKREHELKREQELQNGQKKEQNLKQEHQVEQPKQELAQQQQQHDEQKELNENMEAQKVEVKHQMEQHQQNLEHVEAVEQQELDTQLELTKTHKLESVKHEVADVSVTHTPTSIVDTCEVKPILKVDPTIKYDPKNTDIKLDRFEYKFQRLVTKWSLKHGEPVKKKLKLEVTDETVVQKQHVAENDSTKLLLEAAASSLVLPPPPPPPSPPLPLATSSTSTVEAITVSQASAPSVVSIKSTAISTSASKSLSTTPTTTSTSSVASSTPLVSTPSDSKMSNADSTCPDATSDVSNRKSLSDDDIKERLHSFHKENILFLQSRNKKPKSSTSSFKTDSKHGSNDTKSSSSKLHRSSSHSGSSSSSSSSSSKKLQKKERSSSSSSSSGGGSKSSSNKGISVANTASSGSVATTGAPTSHHSTSTSSSSSSSSSKKVKTLKKSQSIPSHCNLLSSTSSVTVASTVVAPVEKEKSRHRSISTSSTSSLHQPTPPSSKKRQLNFEQELSKDMLICGSGKYRRDDTTAGSLTSSSTSSKKRRESSGGSRFDENRAKQKCMSSTNVMGNNSDSSSKKALTMATATTPTTAATSTTDTNMLVVSAAITSMAVTTATAAASNTSCRVATSIADSKTTMQAQSAASCSQADAVIASNAAKLTEPVCSIAQSSTTPSGFVPSSSCSSPCPTTGNSNILPYYNTIYGKLMDTTPPPHITTQVSSTYTGTQVCTDNIAINCIPNMVNSTSAPSTPTAASTVTPLLSEYLDTKTKSFNTLGGYVSHTAALFGLNATSNKLPISNDLDILHTTSSVASAVEMQTATALSPTFASAPPLVSPVPTKLTTPIKILTKTASHDPRLNPILSAPEPTPAPKRKLSINEYRKRKQQTTSGSSANSDKNSASKDKTGLSSSSSAYLLYNSCSPKSISSSVVTNNCSTYSLFASTNSPPNSSYVPTINKCTLNSPDRSFEMMNKELQEKALNESLLNSSFGYSNMEMPSLRLGEEDTSKVQFSAAPTLLEKQQENICERLKSLKNNQSAADLVTGRLSSIGSEFGLKKDNDLYLSRSSTSDLDNCLEAISSSSTSMASSRESTPERRFHDKDIHVNNRQYNETRVKSDHYRNSSATASIESAASTKRQNYDLA